MDEIVRSIDQYLSQQPWWMIALGTAIIILLFRPRRSPPRTYQHAMHNNANQGTVHIAKSSLSTSASGTGTQFDEVTMEEILKLIRNGDKIAAIKLARQKTGLDLVGAKTMVEDLELKK